MVPSEGPSSSSPSVAALAQHVARCLHIGASPSAADVRFRASLSPPGDASFEASVLGEATVSLHDLLAEGGDLVDYALSLRVPPSAPASALAPFFALLERHAVVAAPGAQGGGAAATLGAMVDAVKRHGMLGDLTVSLRGFRAISSLRSDR